jgi:predicted membrane protein
MESYNKEDFKKEVKNRFDNRSGRVWGGMVLVIIGLLFLAHQAGVDVPHWIFSWEMFAIGIGVYIGARHSFRPGGWIIPIVIGGVFLADDMFYDFNVKPYLWPAIIIGIGLFMIFRPRGRRRFGDETDSISSDDSIDAVSIFGGTKKNIISKDFKGGEITTIFGGTDLNFSQADFKDKAIVDVTNLFGGTKLIIPPHWNIQSEIVCVFGGIDDKRAISKDTPETSKVLILKGTCIFGGIEIKSW